MPIPDVGAAEVAAGVNAHAHPFSGRVVHRQVRRPHAHALWDPGFGPYRWNSGFPALYASLSLDVALAERIKRTLARPVDLVVGVAQADLRITLDLTAPAVQATLGMTAEELTADDHTLTQQLGRRLYDAGATALLVPAAITSTAALYPRFSMRRDGRVSIHATPAQGTNLVIYTDHLRPGDAYPEIERFACIVRGFRR